MDHSPNTEEKYCEKCLQCIANIDGLPLKNASGVVGENMVSITKNIKFMYICGCVSDGKLKSYIVKTLETFRSNIRNNTNLVSELMAADGIKVHIDAIQASKTPEQLRDAVTALYTGADTVVLNLSHYYIFKCQGFKLRQHSWFKKVNSQLSDDLAAEKAEKEKLQKELDDLRSQVAKAVTGL